MKCDHCGATVRKGDGRFCSHCGAKLPDVPRITAEDWATHSERFDEAEASEHVIKAMTTPAPPVPMGGLIGIIVFLALWLAAGSHILTGAGAAGGGFLLVAGGIVGVGVVAMLAAIAKHIRFSRAPAQHLIAVVIDERVNVTRGGDNSSARTHYYATIVGRDGTRRELATTGDVAGQIVAGDIGVAILRMNQLVAFHRA